jgi:phosphoribosylformylglycinamidine synthase
LAEACRGIAEGCRELGTPVTGGNVSLYNETLDSQGKPQAIYPTPVVGMVGLISDLTKICGQGWQAEGDVIYLLGLPIESKVELGGSEYLATIHNIVAGKPPRVDFELERRTQYLCREGIRRGWIRSAHDCTEGGFTVAVSECCLSSKLGAKINLQILANSSQRWDEILFGEAGARIIVSVSSQQQKAWESFLIEQGSHHWQKLGKVGNSETGLRVLTTDNQTLIEVKMEEMSDLYFNAIERRLAIQNTSAS